MQLEIPAVMLAGVITVADQIQQRSPFPAINDMGDLGLVLTGAGLMGMLILNGVKYFRGRGDGDLGLVAFKGMLEPITANLAIQAATLSTVAQTMVRVVERLENLPTKAQISSDLIDNRQYLLSQMQRLIYDLQEQVNSIRSERRKTD